jgi:ribonuclease HI
LKVTPEVVLYTDGACSGNPGPGGWAAILKHTATGKEKKLSGGEPKTTNNRMELTAVIEGLRTVKSTPRRRIHLVSDSQYVIRGLTEWIDGWIAQGWRRGKKPNSATVKNVDLWKTLHDLTERHDMSYEHVLGHSGHPENEECDRMAVAEIDAVRTNGPTVNPAGQSDPPMRDPKADDARVSRVFTNTPWEAQVGYCRAIRAGDQIYVTGTAPVDDEGNTFAPGDPYAQAKRCLEVIQSALEELGASMSHVVRTRMFVTDITCWSDFGRAHREFFADHPPATSMVQVESLIDSEMLIEIEVDAVCPPQGE